MSFFYSGWGGCMSYQKEQDQILASLSGTPKLLLHSCCGPCSSSCLETLSAHFFVTVFWYNPNIYPQEEYFLRLMHQKKLIERLDTQNPVTLITADYVPEQYEAAVKGLEQEPEGGTRCTVCFAQRLELTARTAKEKGFDFFTTTLTVSPHKNADVINTIGQEMAKKYQVAFLPSDFKKKNGYQRSIELSRQYSLYRQNYCGCRFSQRQN